MVVVVMLVLLLPVLLVFVLVLVLAMYPQSVIRSTLWMIPSKSSFDLMILSMPLVPLFLSLTVS